MKLSGHTSHWTLPPQVPFTFLILWLLLILWKKITYNSGNSCRNLVEEQDICYFQERNLWGGEREFKYVFSVLIMHGGNQHMPNRMRTLESTLHYLTMDMHNVSTHKCAFFCKGYVEQEDADIFRKTCLIFLLVYCMFSCKHSVCAWVNVHNFV